MSTSSSDNPVARAKSLALGHTVPSLSGGFYPLPDPSKTHPENTTVFIGGLPGSVGREELEGIFKPFGEVIYVNVPPGKSCGFISFDNRLSAEWAIEQLQGFWLHGTQLRLAWGRLQGEKARQQQQESIRKNEISSSIYQDIPFFTSLLDLSAEQKVKLGLYLEFSARGDLDRLKEIMSMTSPASSTPARSQRGSVHDIPIRTPSSPCACAPLPASRRDPYQSHGELCRHYDRLVSDHDDYILPPSPQSSSPPLSLDSASITTPNDIPSYSSTAFTPAIGHRAPTSISSSSGAIFQPFQPWKSAQNDHRHSENCVTQSKLDKLNAKDESVKTLGWGLGSMGLNVGAGEWVPSAPKAMQGKSSWSMSQHL